MVGSDRGTMARWRRRVLSRASGLTLEIGVGTGLGLRHYPAGALVVAIDPDLGMLGRARARARDAAACVLLVAATAERLPFRDRLFDAAAAELAFCTIPDPDSALREVRRVLRAGAPLSLLEHVRVGQPVVGLLQDWLTPLWRRVAGGCRLNRRTTWTLRAAGFGVSEVVSHLGGLFLEIAARSPGEPSQTLHSRGY